MARKKESICKGCEYLSLRVSFRASVTCTTKALSWPWHKMDKKLVDIRNGGPDLLDEISDAKMLCNEDKRAIAVKET